MRQLTNEITNEIANEIVNALMGFYDEPYKGINLLRKSLTNKWSWNYSDGISRWIAGELLCKLEKMKPTSALERIIRFDASQMHITHHSDHVWFERTERSRNLQVGEIIHKDSGDVCYVAECFRDSNDKRFVVIRLIGKHPKEDGWRRETTEGDFFQFRLSSFSGRAWAYDRRHGEIKRELFPEWVEPAIKHIEDKWSKLSEKERHDTEIIIRQKANNKVEIQEIKSEYISDGHFDSTIDIYLFPN